MKACIEECGRRDNGYVREVPWGPRDQKRGCGVGPAGSCVSMLLLLAYSHIAGTELLSPAIL